tara:strand:+ start:443 stop:1780 length:1338 start_codon:yes stop_codon:yes gene_type:complete
MALFGSLGKMLGLDTPFGQGLVTGFAEGVTREVKDDMKSRKERIDRLADYKIKRDEEERERYTKELRENLEKVKGIAGKAGGINGAEYLIRTYGIEEAVNKAGQIETLSGFGVTPEFATTDENQTTLDDLARFVTADPVFTKLTARGTRADTGLLAKIGLAPDIAVEAQKQRDAAASSLGIGIAEAPDLGAMPTASGFDPSDFGMMADMKDESNRLVRLAISAKEAGDDEAYTKHMADATTMRNMLRMLDTKDVTEAGSRANMNGIISRIEAVSGVEGDMVPDGRNGVRFKAKFEDAADQIKVNKAGSNLNELYTQAIARGIPAATAMRIIIEAEGTNRLPEVKQNPDGSFSFALGNSKLIDGGLTNGTGPYAPPPPATPPPQAQQNQQNQSTQQQSGATSAGAQALVDQHNATRDPRTKGRIRARIGRMFDPNPIPPNIESQLR